MWTGTGVTFTDPTARSTTLTLDNYGLTTIQCKVSDPAAKDGPDVTATFDVIGNDCRDNIGTVTITGPNPACEGQPISSYTANISGSVNNETYQWSGDATFGSPTAATTTATFTGEGDKVITCTVTSVGSQEGSVSEDYDVYSFVSQSRSSLQIPLTHTLPGGQVTPLQRSLGTHTPFSQCSSASQITPAQGST